MLLSLSRCMFSTYLYNFRQSLFLSPGLFPIVGAAPLPSSIASPDALGRCFSFSCAQCEGYFPGYLSASVDIVCSLLLIWVARALTCQGGSTFQPVSSSLSNFFERTTYVFGNVAEDVGHRVILHHGLKCRYVTKRQTSLALSLLPPLFNLAVDALWGGDRPQYVMKPLCFYLGLLASRARFKTSRTRLILGPSLFT